MSDRAVTVSLSVQASPETVFDILSDPGRFSDWIQGEAEFSPEPGSDFRIRFPRFDTVIEGQVLEVQRPSRFVVSWGVAEGKQAEWFPPASSTVRLELEEEGEGTRVTLVHSDLPNEDEVRSHEAGWRFHVSRLSLKANRDWLTKELPVLWEAWSGAWSEADDEERGALLRQCCTEEVAFADEYAEFSGREKLSVHIRNTLQHMPGVRLTSTGEPSICRGMALLPWAALGEGDGEAVARGTMAVTVSADGRFGSVTSFWEGR